MNVSRVVNGLINRQCTVLTREFYLFTASYVDILRGWHDRYRRRQVASRERNIESTGECNITFARQTPSSSVIITTRIAAASAAIIRAEVQQTDTWPGWACRPASAVIVTRRTG